MIAFTFVVKQSCNTRESHSTSPRFPDGLGNQCPATVQRVRDGLAKGRLVRDFPVRQVDCLRCVNALA